MNRVGQLVLPSSTCCRFLYALERGPEGCKSAPVLIFLHGGFSSQEEPYTTPHGKDTRRSSDLSYRERPHCEEDKVGGSVQCRLLLSVVSPLSSRKGSSELVPHREGSSDGDGYPRLQILRNTLQPPEPTCRCWCFQHILLHAALTEQHQGGDQRRDKGDWQGCHCCGGQCQRDGGGGRHRFRPRGTRCWKGLPTKTQTLQICGMEEPLEIPVMNDLTMVLGSISQLKATGVVVDFTDPSTVYDNVKQAAAFGFSSVVYVPRIQLETVTALSTFCEKASMGCLIAPTLSIGSVLLQQAAIQASFHYKNVEIVESRQDASDLPSPEANQIANNLSNLGQIYNREDLPTDNPARGQLLGEDGIRVHSMVLPGLPSSTTVHFSGPGEVYSIGHDITNVQCLMPGLILAIRKVIRLKNLIYGLEKFL